MLDTKYDILCVASNKNIIIKICHYVYTLYRSGLWFKGRIFLRFSLISQIVLVNTTKPAVLWAIMECALTTTMV